MSSLQHLFFIFSIILFSRSGLNDGNKTDQLSTQKEKPNKGNRVKFFKYQNKKLTPPNKQTSTAVSQSKQESHPKKNSPKKLLSKDEEETKAPKIDNKLSPEPPQTQQTSSNKSYKLPYKKRKYLYPSSYFVKQRQESSKSNTTNIENSNTSKNNQSKESIAASSTGPSLEKGQDDNEDSKLDNQEKQLTKTNEALLPSTSTFESKSFSNSNLNKNPSKNTNLMNLRNINKHDDENILRNRQLVIDELKRKFGENNNNDQDDTVSKKTTKLKLYNTSSQKDTENPISTQTKHDFTPVFPSKPQTDSFASSKVRNNDIDNLSINPNTNKKHHLQTSEKVPFNEDTYSRYHLLFILEVISILLSILTLCFLYFKI